jgi:hypothetical protein
MSVHQTTIVIQTRTVPILKGHLTVLASMDIKEMALIVKVGVNISYAKLGSIFYSVFIFLRCKYI